MRLDKDQAPWANQAKDAIDYHRRIRAEQMAKVGDAERGIVALEAVKAEAELQAEYHNRMLALYEGHLQAFAAVLKHVNFGPDYAEAACELIDPDGLL